MAKWVNMMPRLKILTPRFYNNRGTTYHKMNLLYHALVDYTVAISLMSDIASFYFNRGIVFGDLDEFEHSILDLDVAIELDPNNVEYYTVRGDAYFEIGQIEKAMVNFNKVLELDPNNAVAYGKKVVLQAPTLEDDEIEFCGAGPSLEYLKDHPELVEENPWMKEYFKSQLDEKKKKEDQGKDLEK
jgi:tetratricopeptide (TPR) repeat protein